MHTNVDSFKFSKSIGIKIENHVKKTLEAVVECLTQGQGGPWVGASPASVRCCPLARHIYPSLVLVQPRKTCPCLAEILLMGRKESLQTNKKLLKLGSEVDFILEAFI